MVKLSEEQKAKLELDFINRSRELSKFSYENNFKVFIFIIAIIMPFLLAGTYLSVTTKNWTLLTSLLAASCILFVGNYYLHVHPHAITYRKEYSMYRKRYQQLGINPDALAKEFEQIKSH